ncbi:MAG: hypothetical protein K2N33_06065, partial [Clostridia bacterium]|nr:hypothetical protein [Clostridia bacterium]
MKTRKLIMAVVALTMSASAAMSFTACNSHKHDYTNWTQTVAPTCTEQGEEVGTCEADGATQTRKIDPIGHNYGEWNVTEPTQTEKGSAVKTCANGEHPLIVVLPELTSNEYTKTVITEAGATKEGTTKYELANDEGTISFNVATAARGVNTFGDVVLAAAENRDKVRSGAVTVPDAVQGDYTYEYGDNYFHVNEMIVVNAFNGTEYVGSEYFLEQDADGNYYIVVADVAESNGGAGGVWEVTKKDVRVAGFAETDKVNSFKNGYPVSINNSLYSYSTNPEAADYYEKTFNSVEDYLLWLYGISQSEKANGEVKSTWNEETGECKLQFSYLGTQRVEKLGEDGRKVYEITNPDPNGNGVDYTQDEDDVPLLQYNDSAIYTDVPALVCIEVNFTVDKDSHVLTSISSTVNKYAQRGLKLADNQPSSDEQAAFAASKPCKYPDAKVYEEVPLFELKNGVYTLIEDNLPKGNELGTVIQTGAYNATQVVKTAQDVVPENPYSAHKVAVNDFSFYDSVYEWTGDYSLQLGPDGQPEKMYAWIKGDKITDPMGEGITMQTDSDPVKLFIDDVTPTTAVANLNKATLTLTDAAGKKITLAMRAWDETSYDGIWGWYDDSESVVYIRNYVNVGTYTLDLTLGETTKSIKITFEPMAPTSFIAKINSYDEEKDTYVETTATKADIFVGEGLSVFAEATGDAYCAVDSGYTVIVKDGSGNHLSTDKYTLLGGANGYSVSFTDAGDYILTLKSDKGDKTADIAVTVTAVPTLDEIVAGNLQHKASNTTASFDTTAKTVEVTVDGKTATFNYVYNETTKEFALTFVAGGSAELNGAVALNINVKNHVVLTYGNGPEPKTYVLTVPSGNPIDEAYDAITSSPWSLKEKLITYTFTKDGV